MNCNVQRRLFARADIRAALNKEKISKRKYIKTEITENPEFFKAYPHLQALTKEFVGEEEENFEHQGLANEYAHDAVLKFKNPKEEVPYFDSLL